MRHSITVNFAAIVFVALSSLTCVSSFSVPRQSRTSSPAAAASLFSRGEGADGTGRDEAVCYQKFCEPASGGLGSPTALRGGNDGSQEAAATETNNSYWTPAPTASEAYYLVWSPKFVPKLALATVFLSAFRRFRLDRRALGIFAGALGWVPAGVLPNLVWPLLSSSCCAIQLSVNAASVAVMGAGAGCLGFNTYLGPVRPYFLAVMLAYHTLPVTPSTWIRFAIALMPEFVFGWNQALRSRWRRKGDGKAATLQATVVVEVPTMDCVACVNKIETSLRNRAPDNIESASAVLNPKPAKEGGKKGGKAQIKLKASSKDELDNLAKSLVGAIEGAGFTGSKIETMEVQQIN